MCEMASCYGCEVRKARKHHICCECGCSIVIGEKYHYHHGVWNGSGASYKVCMGCEDLRKDLNVDQRYDEQICFGQLSDSWFNRRDNWDKEISDFRAEIASRKGL